MLKKYFKRIFRKDHLIKRPTWADELITRVRPRRWPSRQQWKYLPRILAPREKFWLKIFGLVFAVALLFLGGRLYFSWPVVPQEGGEYAEGIVGIPQYINSVLALGNEADQDLTRLVFNGLLAYDEKGNLVPDLASSFAVSDDRKSYVFQLKPSVFWHDGEKFTADDVIYTFSIIKSPKIRSPLALSFQWATAEKLDTFTVKFTLKEPFAPFLSLLTVGILPEHLWLDIPAQQIPLTEYNLKPIGTGPYKFKSLTKDRRGLIKSYTLSAYPDYHKGKPFIEKLQFKFYLDAKEAVEALKQGNVDGLSFFPKDIGQKIRSEIELRGLRLPQYTALFINTKNNSALTSRSVRVALATAIDKKKLVEEALANEAVAIASPILAGYPGYDPSFEDYQYDPERARQIIKNVGYQETEEGWKKGDDVLAVKITTINQPAYVAAAETIKLFWEAIGVKVELLIREKEKMQTLVIKPRDYEILLFSEILGADPDPYSFWHSSQRGAGGLNLTDFADRRVDELLEEARAAGGDEARKEKYLAFQKILHEQVPAVFLYSPFYNYPLHKKIKGFNLSRVFVPSDRFTGIEKWYIKTKRRPE